MSVSTIYDDVVTDVYEPDVEMELQEEAVDPDSIVDPYGEGVEVQEVYEETEATEYVEGYEMEVVEQVVEEEDEVAVDPEAVVEEVVEETVEEQEAIVEDMSRAAGAEADFLSQCRQELVQEDLAEEAPEDVAMEAVEGDEVAESPAPAACVPPAAGVQGMQSKPETGYVFVCSRATQAKCAAHRLMGSPDWELPQMLRSIRQGATLIFLFNLETHTLVGPFHGVGAPRRAIVPHAFEGRFTSQVRVAATAHLQEVKLEARIKAGPKSVTETEQLKDCLEQGELPSAEDLALWKAPIAEEAAAAEVQPQAGGCKGLGWKGGIKGAGKMAAPSWGKGKEQMWQGKGAVGGPPWAPAAGLKRPWGEDQGPAWAKRPRMPGILPGMPVAHPAENRGEKTLRAQVEYYFSDKNLEQDEFFHGKMSEDPQLWMDAARLLGCKKVKELGVSTDFEIEEALQDSHLETRRKPDGGLQVRRVTPLPPLKKRSVAPPKIGQVILQNTQATVAKATVGKAAVGTSVVGKAFVPKIDSATTIPGAKAVVAKSVVVKMATTQAQGTNAPVTKAPVVPAQAFGAKAPVAKAPVAQVAGGKALIMKAPVAQWQMAKAPVTKVPVAQVPDGQVAAPKAPLTKVAQAAGAKVPVTKAAVSQFAGAKAPVSKAPIVQAAGAKAPVAKAPVAQAAGAKAPVTKAPVAQVAGAKAVVTKAPVAQAAGPRVVIAKAPVAQVAGAKAPVVKAPVAQAPGARAPVATATVSQAAGAKAPLAKAPVPQVQGAKASVAKAPVAQVQGVRAVVTKAPVAQVQAQGATVQATRPLATKAPVAPTPGAKAPVVKSACPQVAKAPVAKTPLVQCAGAQAQIAKAPVVKATNAQAQGAKAPVAKVATTQVVKAVVAKATIVQGHGAKAPVVKAAVTQLVKAAIVKAGFAHLQVAKAPVAKGAVAGATMAGVAKAPIGIVRAAGLVKAGVAKVGVTKVVVAKAAVAARMPKRVYTVGEAVRIVSGEHQGQSGEVLAIDDADITVLVGGADIALLTAEELSPTTTAGNGRAVAVAAPVPVPVDPQVLENKLAAMREELRQIIIAPEHISRFLNKGRLVYIKDGDADWGWGILASASKAPEWALRVFLPVFSEEGPAGQVLDMALSTVLRISKVCTKPPEDSEAVEAQGTLVNILTKVKDHPKFKDGIPNLDPVAEMHIPVETIGPVNEAIKSLEQKLAK